MCIYDISIIKRSSDSSKLIPPTYLLVQSHGVVDTTEKVIDRTWLRELVTAAVLLCVCNEFFGFGLHGA